MHAEAGPGGDGRESAVTVADLVRELWADKHLAAEWAGRCARVLGAEGIAVSLRVRGAEPEVVCCSGEISALLDDLEFTLGEGPATDASRDGQLSLVSDVRRLAPERWPVFAPGALELGVRGLLCVPLQWGALHLGALTGYRSTPWPLCEQATEQALSLADSLTGFLLSGPVALAGVHVPTYEADAFDLHRTEIHQATGMLSTALRVPLATALLRLRAFAFSEGRPVCDVARDIVHHGLTLPADPGPPPL